MEKGALTAEQKAKAEAITFVPNLDQAAGAGAFSKNFP